MTHDPDLNITMPTDPPMPTDIFEYLMGEGFVMVNTVDLMWGQITNSLNAEHRHCRIGKVKPDPLASVRDQLKGLEGLLG